MANMYNLIRNCDLAGVQRAVQDNPALLDATIPQSRCTPLMFAISSRASWGQPGAAIIQWLVERGANLDLQDNKGWTALTYALRNNQPDRAQLLVERGAKLDLKDNEGLTALIFACRNNQHATAKLLIEGGANLDLQDANGWTALTWAYRNNQPNTAKLLVERGANLDLQDGDGWTALIYACRNNQPDTAKLLVERGAKLDLKDNEGFTALTYACRNKDLYTAQLLIERGADPNLQTNDGWTALMYFFGQPARSHQPYGRQYGQQYGHQYGHTFNGSHRDAALLLRFLKLCYAADVDLDLKNNEGNDVLAVVKRHFHRADVVAFLEFATMLEVARSVQGKLQEPRAVVAASSLLSQNVSNGETDIEAILGHAQNIFGKSQTPLMQACKNGDVARVKDLLVDGAQIDARDSLSLTPVIYACKFNSEQDSLSLVKVLFKQSAGLLSECFGIKDALTHAFSKDRKELLAFLSFIHSLPLEHFHTNALRVKAVNLFDQGVRTLEEARCLAPARLEQLGISSAQDRHGLSQAFADSVQTSKVDALATTVSLARTKRGDGTSNFHPRLLEIFAEQLLRKDPVSYFADFDMQQVFLRGKEQDLMALQEAVKTDSTKISERDETRRELVKGIRKALSGGVEGQLESILAAPGTKAVIDTCRSLWKEIFKTFVDADNADAPVAFEDVQEATQAAMEAIKAWETRHDPSSARKCTEAAIDALDDRTKRLGIQATFFMTLRHPERTRGLAMELQNVQQALKSELSTLTDFDRMADAPLKEVRRALACTISFYTCTVKDEVSRLQKAVEDLSSSLSKHVPGLAAPDTSRVIKIIKKIRTSKRDQAQLEYEIKMATFDEQDGISQAKERVRDLKEKLSKVKRVFRLNSDLSIERERILRHADKHFPELSQDTKWLESIGMAECVPQELIKLGIWLTDVTLEDFETLETLASKLGKSVLKVRDPDGQEFVLKIFHLVEQSWRSRFYRQVAALAQIKSAYVVRFQSAFLHGTSQGCILMPFYAGGDLAAWIRDNPHADVPTRTRIAIGLLSGLHDLHSRGYVHCDVKPENVFLTAGLWPVLGDFDGVQMQDMTMTQPMQSTFKYMAPELHNGNVKKVEPAVDMFSVGAILSELFNGSLASQNIRSLISNLTSANANKRPTALQAMRHPAFLAEPEEMGSCAICLETFPVSEGVSCSDKHFTCEECLSSSVRAATQPDAHVNVLRDGSMCCVTPDCELLISGRTIAAAVPDKDFAALLDIVRKHFERDAAFEQERQLQLRLDAALREHGLDPATQNHIRTIQNEILTMSCPRCAAAFVDFDGCCALKCGACPCHFCAWCLQDTGNDSQASHQHVARCVSKPAGEDRFFGQKNAVQQVWCRLRAQRLRDYMAHRIQYAQMRVNVQERLRPLLTPDIVGNDFSF